MFRDPEGKVSAVRVMLVAWAGSALVLWVIACAHNLAAAQPLADVPSGVLNVLITLAGVRGVQAVGERFGHHFK